MKRKIYLLFTVLLMMAATSAWADKVQIGNLYYNLNSDGTATVTYPNESAPSQTNPSSYKGDITIPATVDYGGQTYKVTAVGDSAFSYSTITSITFSEGLNTIGSNSFARCKSIKTVVLPNSVTQTGGDAFAYSGITTFTIGSGLTTINQGITYGCPITDVYLRTTTVPKGAAYMFSSQPKMHVYPDMMDRFQTDYWWDYKNYVPDLERDYTYTDVKAFYDKMLALIDAFTGDNPGQYSSAHATSYKQVLAKYSGISETTSQSELNAAMKEMANAYYTLPANPITEGYYYIVCDNAKIAQNKKSEKALYIEASKKQVYWGALETQDLKFVFKLTPNNDGTWNLFNVETGLYAGAASEFEGKVSATASATYPATFYLDGEASYRIKANNWTYCPHGNAEGTSDGPGYVWGFNAMGVHGEASYTLRKIENKDVLTALINKWDGTVVPSEDPGRYTEASAKQLADAVAAAKTIDASDTVAFSTAYNNIQSAANALKINPITEGYYFITSAGKGSGYKDGPYNDEDKFALYNSNNLVKWAAYKGDKAQLYKFTTNTAGGWNVFSVADNTYINKIVDGKTYNADVSTSNDPTTAQVFTLIGDGKYTMTFSGNANVYALTGSHNGSAGKTSGNLNVWGNIQEAKSYGMNQWYLHKVSATELAKLLETPAPVADVLDVVFHADGSATDVNKHKVENLGTRGTQTAYNANYGKYMTVMDNGYKTNQTRFYKVDYAADDDIYNALKDGYTLQTTFCLTNADNTATGEAKIFGSTSSGGTAILLNGSHSNTEGGNIEFVVNTTSTDGTSKGWKRASSGIRPQLNTFYNVVAVWDGEKATLYVDGKKAAEADAAGTYNFPSDAARYWFCIGANVNVNKQDVTANSTPNDGAPWKILSTRIYDKPLTELEVAALYNQEQESMLSEEQATLIGNAESRNLYPGLNTACEPFAIKAAKILNAQKKPVEGVKLYTYDQTTEANTIRFTDATESGVPAGVPCLIELPETASAGSYYFDLGGILKDAFVSEPTEATPLVGTFKEINPLGEGYYKLNGKEFLKTIAASVVAPFRFYLNLGTVANANGYSISLGDDDDITGISNTTSSLEKQVTGIYDANGRKYSRLQKGINILRYSDGTSAKIIVK